MKIILLFFLSMNFIFSQCSELGTLECNLNSDCEWIEDIETGNCSNYDNSTSCDANDNCNWDCIQYGWWYNWCYTYGCEGGNYQIDNGYCQEIEMPECSEMNEIACVSDDNCAWVEDITIGNCSDITNGSECYQTNQCSWYNAGPYGYLYDNCYGGTYEIDSSYCEESIDDGATDCTDLEEDFCNHPLYGYGCEWVDDVCQEINEDEFECSDLNEFECSDNSNCEWFENIELESCNDINSQQECNAVGCSWYNGSYYACSICCWGDYEVDNSYCGESLFDLGDVNQDSLINVLDAIQIINLILSQDYNNLADMNSDQIINIIDVVLLVDIILN